MGVFTLKPLVVMLNPSTLHLGVLTSVPRVGVLCIQHPAPERVDLGATGWRFEPEYLVRNCHSNNAQLKGEIDTALIAAVLGEIELPAGAISRSHRVGKRQDARPDGKTRHRPIIFRFTTYRAERMVFQSKSRLKGLVSP